MEKLLLLVAAFAICHAEPRDMSGKVFIFPHKSNSTYVKLLTIGSQNKFDAVTTCLRFQTDLPNNYVLFSLATPTHINDYLLFKSSSENVVRLHTRDLSTDFLSVPLYPNVWHSMCSTWSSKSGVAQLWVDGNSTVMRFIQKEPISGEPTTILGQEQDSVGGGFDAKQSFLGIIADVHMWDHIVASEEIKHYMRGQHFSPGNVYNWRNLNFECHGKVLISSVYDVRSWM